MPARLALAILVAALVSACAQKKVETPQGAVYLQSCDDGGEDGGDGGVIINGVCL